MMFGLAAHANSSENPTEVIAIHETAVIIICSESQGK